jgi:hypothetical protein
MPEPDPTSTPATVIGAVAAGTVVVPFLIVYSFLFIVRGGFVQVEQPDITGSRTGELIAGLIALAFLIAVAWGIGRLLDGRDRWAFLAGQVLTLAIAANFVLNSSYGGRPVSVVVLLAAALAVLLACLPASWRWVATSGGQDAGGQNAAAQPADGESAADLVARHRPAAN